MQGFGKLLTGVLDAQRGRVHGFGQRGVLGAAGRVEAGGFMVSGLGLLQCLLKLLLGSVRGCDGGLQRGRSAQGFGHAGTALFGQTSCCAGGAGGFGRLLTGVLAGGHCAGKFALGRLQLRAQRRELGCGGACGFQLTAQDCG